MSPVQSPRFVQKDIITCLTNFGNAATASSLDVQLPYDRDLTQQLNTTMDPEKTFAFDFSLEWSDELDLPLRTCDGFPGSHAPGTTDDRDISFPELDWQAFQQNALQKVDPTHGCDEVEMPLQQTQLLGKMPVESSSLSMSNEDWDTLLNGPSPNEASVFLEQCTEVQRPVYQSRSSASNVAILSTNIPRYVNRRARAISEPPFAINTSLGSIIFHGADPECIISPLQLLRSQIPAILNKELWRPYRCPRLTTEIEQVLGGSWLLSEVENVLCWSYEASTKLSQQRKIAIRQCQGKVNTTFSSKTCHGSGEVLTPDDLDVCLDGRGSKSKGKFAKYCVSMTPMGTIRVELRKLSAEAPDVHVPQVQYIVTASVFPKAQNRTAGISAIFAKSLGVYHQSRISPVIATFNVIPNDSEIIQRIIQNDLQGVRRLFGERKASPRDVDSGGFSLLSVGRYYHMKGELNTDDKYSTPCL